MSKNAKPIIKWCFTTVIACFLISCNSRESRLKQTDNRALSDNKNERVPQIDNEQIVGSFKEKLKSSDSEVSTLNSMINKQEINKEKITVIPNEAEYFTTYLGIIKLEKKVTHVFKQYYTIQAAIVKHGHSELIFVNNDYASFYDLDTFDNLPNSLNKGAFRFIRSQDTVNMKIEHISENAIVFSMTD